MAAPAAPATAAKPVGYVLYHRTGARWAKVLETMHHSEAVARMRGPGDWWIAEVRDPKELSAETLRPSLFD